MNKYQRLKSDDGSDSVTRYFPLADDEEAYTNCFYGIADDEASKIEGTASGVDLIGFSFGGNNVVGGKILLDYSEHALYMCRIEEGDEKPSIGDLINGYQRVVDVHDNEDMDEPYYVFRIEQPSASNTGTIDDDDAGIYVPGQKKTEA